LAYAPYGDNASYYHPPIDRFDGVEVVKGGGQILYGPRTVGAVVNYLTPAPPEKFSGGLTLSGGSRGYVQAHGRVGGTLARTGILLDYLRKQGHGARENLHHALNDVNLKTLTTLGPQQTLGVRFSALTEDSQVTYSGLRAAEYQANPRGNPFVNDDFTIRRYGASLRHSWAPASSFLLNTAGYGTWFSRDWWRQSSNSNQRPNDAADPACGGMANLLTTCGNEGRLRDYATWGVEARARLWLRRRKLQQEADFGARIHFENQDRRQENGPLPASRAGLLVESNVRKARAFSVFLQDAVTAGRWTLTPGVRVERIHYRRSNRLAPGRISGEMDLTATIPGVAVAYHAGRGLTLFAGAHRGFAPPRVEDVISNSTGAAVDLDPELSWNYEAGLRARVTRGLLLEGTYFRLDFQNQIVPSSVAGGVGATLTNGGRTLHQGLEFSSRMEWQLRSSRHRQYWRTAYTWLPAADFRGVRFSNVPGFGAVSITGNRLPYAPANLLTTAVGYVHATGLTLNLEAVYTGRQFGDDLNSRAGTADGQRGLLPGHAVFNATLNVPVESWRTTFFVTSKNLFDRLYIADRSRGILPGPPRLVQAGLSWQF
jgi:Fe(3+) dicitrate transport protein